jgi:catechol 2,3-dioxygenase-like lactoylglutathione lyase family enzyme
VSLMQPSHQMRLAKPAFDICLVTNHIEAVLEFWRDAVGLTRDEVLPIREGLTQHRHSVAGSVIKLNHQRAPRSADQPAGYRELIIAREGLAKPLALMDPDGNRVAIVPPGVFGVHQIGVRMHVRDLAATRRFFDWALGLPTTDDAQGARVIVGESHLLLTEDPTATSDPPVDGLGWRYLSLQIFDTAAVYDDAVLRGARVGRPPKTLGTVARYAFVRDPDGNWIELSQRASLTGPITP